MTHALPRPAADQAPHLESRSAGWRLEHDGLAVGLLRLLLPNSHIMDAFLMAVFDPFRIDATRQLERAGETAVTTFDRHALRGLHPTRGTPRPSNCHRTVVDPDRDVVRQYAR